MCDDIADIDTTVDKKTKIIILMNLPGIGLAEFYLLKNISERAVHH